MSASAKTALTGELADRFNAISDRLVCQCNCRMILGVCNHQNCPSGIPRRQEIETKLQQGAGDAAIVEGFVSRMGPIALSAPPAKGGYLLAWILPGCLLLAGAILIATWLAKQKRRENRTSAPSPALNPQDEEKFKKEWERWNRP